MTEQNIPPIPPPYNGDSGKRTSKKWIYWLAGIIVVLAVGLVVAIQMTKAPDDNLQADSGDPVREMLSEEEWSEAENYAKDHGHISETEDWEMLYMRDEFGEEQTSHPYLRHTIGGYKYYGQSPDYDYDNMTITLDPQYGMKLSIGTGVFNGNDRIIIKHNSGNKEEISFDMLDDGDIVITDPSTIRHFIDILQSGNFEMAIAGDANTRRWNFVIENEFKSVRKALRFLRDVPNVESIYGRIN